jgi:hypothetical protein
MNELLKLKPNVATGIFACVGIFTSSVFSIFLLNRPLFFKLDILEIIAVGLGISCPCLMLGLIISIALTNHPKQPQTEQQKQESWILDWSFAGIGCTFILNIFLLVAYLIGISLKVFYAATGILEFIAAIVAVYSKITENSDTKPSQPVS